jgi:predicted transcriptional regulator
MGRPPGEKFPEYITVRLDPDVKKFLEGIAHDEERPLSQVARMLIREAVAARQGQAGSRPGPSRKRTRP